MSISAIRAVSSMNINMNTVSQLKADEKKDMDKIGMLLKSDDMMSQTALKAAKNDLADVHDVLQVLKPDMVAGSVNHAGSEKERNSAPITDEDMNRRFGAAYQVELGGQS